MSAKEAHRGQRPGGLPAFLIYFLIPFHSFLMPQCNFTLPESQEVWTHIETAAQRSHNNPQRAFEDFLTMSVCSLSGGQMEDEYLAVIKPYCHGEKGRRAIDAFPAAFAAIVNAMEETNRDILGDIFCGAITHGHHGQFFTPDHVCTLIAGMQISSKDTGKRILDPCCGSGRMLLAAADINRSNTFLGQDLDLRCVQMTTLNLALRNLSGWVIHGNALTDERRQVYRTGFNGKGFLTRLKGHECPENVKVIVNRIPATSNTASETPPQLALF